MYVRSLPSARVRVTHVIRVGTSNGICRAPAGPGRVSCPSGRPSPVTLVRPSHAGQPEIAAAGRVLTSRRPPGPGGGQQGSLRGRPILSSSSPPAHIHWRLGAALCNAVRRRSRLKPQLRTRPPPAARSRWSARAPSVTVRDPGPDLGWGAHGHRSARPRLP